MDERSPPALEAREEADPGRGWYGRALLEGSGAPDRSLRPADDRAQTVGPPTDAAPGRAIGAVAVSRLGYDPHLGTDRRRGFIRPFTLVASARLDVSRHGTVRDPENTGRGVRGAAGHRGEPPHRNANLALAAGRSLSLPVSCTEPRGQPMPAHLARGDTDRGRMRSLGEHGFVAQKLRMGRVVRSIDPARPAARVAPASLVDAGRRSRRRCASAGRDRSENGARPSDPHVEKGARQPPASRISRSRMASPPSTGPARSSLAAREQGLRNVRRPGGRCGREARGAQARPRRAGEGVRAAPVGRPRAGLASFFFQGRGRRRAGSGGRCGSLRPAATAGRLSSR